MRATRRIIVVALTVALVLAGFWSTPPVADAYRPLVRGMNGAVSAGDPLTTAAAFEVLLKGGNAFDAGVAALLVGGVVEQDLYSLGGEALILVYPRKGNRVLSIVGQGWAPKYATVDWFVERGKDLAGEGLNPSVIPAAIDAALVVLERWGTMSLEQVAARAIEYAEKGHQLRPRTAASIKSEEKFIKQWPDNVRMWLKPDGSFYEAGDVIRMPDLANTLRKLVAAERANQRLGRTRAIRAARDRFYKGDIAQEMVAFLNKAGYPYEMADFAEYFSRVEEPAMTTYKGFKVYKHGFNSQGPVLLQTLNILENFDLKAMKHNSVDYIHTIIEAMKLAYADRDTYYADPQFVKIPAKGLLSKEYARERAAMINPNRANPGLIAGDPMKYDPEVKEWPYWKANITGAGASAPTQPKLSARVDGAARDTTHIAIIDRDGNVFDSTPSGGWIGGAVILGRTGIGMSVRGEQFWLDKTRAQQIRPRSRPRYTLTPSLILRGNTPFMAIGTPGGDNQDQTILQTFLNMVEFWDAWYPNVHTAIDWPRFQTLHFHGSFWPHTAGLNRMNVEVGIPDEVMNGLRARGHNISRVRQYGVSGCATLAFIDPKTGVRITGSDPRRECYAIAY